jgi:hypothetical protein
MFVSLRPAQVITLAVSATLAVGLLRVAPTRQRVIVAVVVIVSGLCLALIRVTGRSLVEWVPEIGSFYNAGLTGNRRVFYRAARGGMMSKAPRLFGEVRFLEVSYRDRTFGGCYDPSDRSLSAVIPIEGEPFALMDEDDRDQMSTQWSALLSALSADRSVFRLKWIHQTTPDVGANYRRSVVNTFFDKPSTELVDAQHSYLSLCEQLQQDALRSDQYLVISTQISRPLMAKSRGESERGMPSRFDDFAKQVVLLERRLAEMGFRSDGVLAKYGIEQMTQRRFDASHDLIHRSTPWPAALEEHWESIRTDGLWHATYWIAEWPKSEVPSGFLLPLLLDQSVRRTVTLCMSPLPATRAIRSAEQRRTSSVADADLRKRYGFALSSRVRSQHEAVIRREEELASGHVGFEFSGYVSVSASSLEDLARACEHIEQNCALAHLELRRLFGMQREALIYGLANARGCQ